MAAGLMGGEEPLLVHHLFGCYSSVFITHESISPVEHFWSQESPVERHQQQTFNALGQNTLTKEHSSVHPLFMLQP